MGIQDREYYRDGSRGPFDGWGRQGVTVWLIALTCGVFFGQCLTGNPLRSPLVAHGSFWPAKIIDGELWRLVTPLFLHADLWHLFLNMLVLFWAGMRLVEVYGSREFLAFYLSAGVASHGLATLIDEFNVIPVGRGVGASGAISALVVLFAFRFPRQQVLLFLIIPMPMWVAAALFVVVDALGAVGVGQAGIGYVVHLAGAFFGLVYYQTGFRFGSLFSRTSRAERPRPRPQLRVVPVDPQEQTPAPVGAAVETSARPKDATVDGDDQLEARLDQVLAKVSKYGQESLTPEEREILFRASELYKKRRK